MVRGGRRIGAGRPSVDDSLKAKNCTFKLYQWEIPVVKDFIKKLRFDRKANIIK
jgi:hypothetical protein